MGLDALAVAVEGLDHPEGVCVTRDGVVYAGGEAGQVYRVDLAARRVEQVADTGGFLLGVTADGDGRLYVCDVARRELLRVDPASGDVTVVTTGTSERPLVNPNWSVFDDAGDLYLTDSGTWKGGDGRVLRVRPDGATTDWCTETTDFPNGACLTADGSALLVLESTTPALVRVPIRDDGSAGAREVVAELPGTIPDGITLDVEGRAYVCCYRPDRILRVEPDGAVEVLADDPDGTLLSAPTNGVWVGDGKLLVGNLGRWHLTICDFGVEGVPLRYPVPPS